MMSSQKTPPLTVPTLPVDVVIEIFCRLPVKSLLRFRCLSKQFRSIIDGPDFIKRHLQNHSLDQRLIVHGMSSRHVSDLFSVDFDSANNVLQLEHPFESWGVNYTLVGSCNGLLAVSHRRRIRLVLWNVSTKKHHVLPRFRSDFDLCLGILYLRKPIFDGFGYDVTTDDYKWVRVTYFDTEKFTEVTVYSLKANSWRRIEDLPPYHNYSVEGRGVLVGGALNWVVRVRDVAYEDSKWRVLSFDLKGEQFCQFPVPKIGDENDCEFAVVVSGECLCLSCFNPSKHVFDVWVMKEHGVKESWTKLFSFTEEKPLRGVALSSGIIAFTYSKCADKVLFYGEKGQVIWHDLEEETDESVKMNEWTTFIYRAVIYVDSLVSPNVNI